MDIFEKIVTWNQQRGLIEKGFNYVNEVSFIVEELLESTGRYDSVTARDMALKYAHEIVRESKVGHKDVIDALADIIIFATGAIAKCGYSPTKVMDEAYKEIDSRRGVLVDGKFVRDKDFIPYTADYSTCKADK